MSAMSAKNFNPAQFKRVEFAKSGPDADLMDKAVIVEVPNTNNRDLFIPAFPLRFLQQVAPVGDALSLLLVALAKMRMSGESEIALGPALWSMIGNPGPRVRSRLLKQIAGLPESLCTLEARTGRPHLLRTGPDWPVKMMNRRQG